MSVRRERPALAEASVPIRVPFHDVDVTGLVWHGRYLKYLEVARSALFETFDYDYREMAKSRLAWPIVDIRLRYVRPARLGQRLSVRARLTEYQFRLRVDYPITDATSGERLTRGYSIQAPVDIATGELVFGTPAIICEKLGLEP